MLQIKKYLRAAAGSGICLAVLTAVPLLAWMSGWHWNPHQQSSLISGFYFATETVSNPAGIVTTLLLVTWLLWIIRPDKTRLWLCAVVLMAPIAVGQLSVSVLKRCVQEPRPYAVWLNHNDPQAIQQFYLQDPAERGMTVLETLKRDTTIPVWQKEHWANESSWSFPSGHTIFAATWALLGMGILWPRKRYVAAIVMLAWATSVLVSRLLLGMHWPVDLLASIGLAFVITRPSLAIINHYVPRYQNTFLPE